MLTSSPARLTLSRSHTQLGNPVARTQSPACLALEPQEGQTLCRVTPPGSSEQGAQEIVIEVKASKNLPLKLS